MLPIHGQPQSPGSKAWSTLSTAASNAKASLLLKNSFFHNKRKGFPQCLKVSSLTTYIQIAVRAGLRPED